MKWENVLESICAAPAIALDLLMQSGKLFYKEEKELVQNGEFDPEELEE